MSDKAPDDAPVTADMSLAVAAGAGFRSDLDGDSLVIEQDNPARPEQPDNLTFSKSEFYVLIKKYAEWAGVSLAIN